MRLIYVKIILGIILIVILNVLINIFLLARFIKSEYNSYFDDRLYSNAIILAEHIKKIGIEENNYSELNKSIKNIGDLFGLRITVILNNGIVIADSFFDYKMMKNHIDRPEIISALQNGTGKSQRESPTLRIPMAYLAIPIKYDNNIKAVLRVAYPQKTIKEKILHSMIQIIFYGVFIGALIAIILTFFIARLYSKPIEMIKDAAVNISKGNFAYKLKLKRNDELSDVAASLNEMSEKLNQYFESMKEDNERITAILSGINEPLVLIGVNDLIYLANNAFKNIFNLSDVSIKEEKYFDVIKDENIINFIKSELEYHKPAGSDSIIQYNYNKNYFRLSSSPIISEHGPFRGIVVIFHDISGIKEMEKMRKEFVDNASHELKTPLSGIIITAETLLEKDPADSTIRKKFYQSIFDNSKRLHSLINDLLDLSEIEHKRAILDKTSQNICILVSEILEMFAPMIKTKNHKIFFDFDEDIPEINIDKKNMNKAFSNIIDNAIRYTDPGGKISVKIEKDLSGLFVVIEDNGIGIPEKYINRVFERFYRVDKTRSIKLGGTGLGLSIAKHIIEAHGGNIKLESEQGKGSKFIIFIPFN